MGTHLSNKYSQKILDSAKRPATDAIKAGSRRVILKAVEATGDLIGNKVQIKLRVHQNVIRNYIHKIIQVKQINQKKDIYLQKNGNKLLMN